MLIVLTRRAMVFRIHLSRRLEMWRGSFSIFHLRKKLRSSCLQWLDTGMLLGLSTPIYALGMGSLSCFYYMNLIDLLNCVLTFESRGYQRVGENVTKGLPDMHEAIDVGAQIVCSSVMSSQYELHCTFAILWATAYMFKYTWRSPIYDVRMKASDARRMFYVFSTTGKWNLGNMEHLAQ